MVGRPGCHGPDYAVEQTARIAIAIVLTLASATLWAQPARAGRRAFLYFDPSQEQGPAREDMVFLQETLLARLHRAGLLMLEQGGAAAPQTDEARGQLALERGADCWVRIVVSSGGGGLTFAVSGVDLLAGGTPLTVQTFERDGMRGIEGPFWDDVAQAIVSAFPPLAREADPARVRTGSVIVKALAGTRVLGLGPEEVEIGEDGTARVQLTRPGLYTIEARRAGSLTLRQTRYLTAEDTVLELAQMPTPRWMFEGYTLNASYLGASAAEIFGPFYLRIGVVTYVLAPWLRNEGDDQADAALPLTDVAAAFGYQPLGPDAPVRPYLDLSAFVRIMHAGGSLAVEPVAPIGYRAAAGIEIRGGKRLRAFADYGPAVYDVHGSDPATVEASITVNGQRASGYFYKPWWGGVFESVMVDLVAFRLGVRWYR